MRVTPIPKPVRKDDGAFRRPAGKFCIMCGAWGGIERHHGISKGAGGDSTEENRFDLCPVCHGMAQEYRPGFLLADLKKAKAERRHWQNIAEMWATRYLGQ